MAFDIKDFLLKIAKKNISDVHITLGKPPAVRKAGVIIKVNLPPVTQEDITEILKEIAPGDFYLHYADYGCQNLDFTYVIENVSRFRANYSLNFGNPRITLRTIPYEPLLVNDLKLPPVLNNLTKLNNGIIFLTGPTGSGKSTTIAALIETINREKAKHIITIEDPIEFIFRDKKSLITQKSLGVDIESFALGVKFAMRQDPDIILVGEIRDRDTMESALAAAETGHLVLSTIHSNSAINTIDRVVNLFDEQIRSFMLERLANSLRAVIAQKLIPTTDGTRLPAVELLTVTSTVKDYMNKKNYDEIYELMRKNETNEMFTLNSSLYNMLKSGKITNEIALEYSDEKVELQQMMSGSYRGTAKNYMDTFME